MNQVNMLPWIVTFGVVAVCTIIGNLLFLVVFFKSDRLRRMRTSLLLISLTAADLIVGAVAIPMYMAVLWPGSNVANSNAFIQSYDVIDVVSGFASLFGLAVIALERVYSVFWPHKHRSLSKTPYYLALFVIWFIAVLQVISILLQSNGMIKLKEFVFFIFPWMTAVVIVIILSYCAVWIKLKTRGGNNLAERRVQENKLAKTLAILTGIFLITWLPFYVINGVLILCIPCRHKLPLRLAVYATKLLHYSNSLANPVVYSFRFPEVRRTLAKICCGRKGTSRAAPRDFQMQTKREKGSPMLGCGDP